jgi:hypothetical protein
MSVDDQQKSEPAPAAPEPLVEPLPGNLRKGLERNLQDGEAVAASARTSAGEAIVVTDRRVLVIKAGLITGAGLFGARTRSIPYSRIVAVDLRLAPMGGHLKIATMGLQQLPDATSFKLNNDENTVSFGHSRKEYMRRVAALIVDRVRASQPPAAPPPSGDLAGQLTALAGIRDRGLLTDAEFEQAKARLLRDH